MAKDYTKYEFDGNVYTKGRLVLVLVKEYVSKHEGLSKEGLLEVFPQSLQGSIGVISSIEEAEGKYKGQRHFIKDPIRLSNATVAVCNQWDLESIEKFIAVVTNMGYNVKESKTAGQAIKTVDHSEGAFEVLRNFVFDVFAKAGIETEIGSVGDIMELNQVLKASVEEGSIDGFYDENDDVAELLTGRVSKMAEAVEDVGDLWKYAMLFQTFDHRFGTGDALEETIRPRYLSVAESFDDVIALYKVWLDDNDLLEGEAERAGITQSDVDQAIGYFCLALEVLIDAGDEVGITDFVTGFGNYVSFDNAVSDFVGNMNEALRNELQDDTYMQFLLHYFQIDTFDEDGEFRSEEDGVDWEAVASEICSTL